MANKVVISIVSLVLVVAAVLGVVAVIVKSGNSNKNISTSTKAVDTVCKPTEYKKACNKVAIEVAKNSSATHEDYIIASIRATADELQKALKKATAAKDDLDDDKKDSNRQEGLETSNELTFNAQKIEYNVLDILKDIEVDFGDLKLPSTGSRRLLDELHEIEHAGFLSWVSTADRKLLGAKKGGGGKMKQKGQTIFKTPPPPPLPPKALETQSDRQDTRRLHFDLTPPHTVMVDCSFEGYQDTLYYHAHDQFYKNYAISGTVNFIFGFGRAYIQDSEIFVRKPDKNQASMVTADGRMKFEEAGGVVLYNCKIMAAPELAPVKGQYASYLGRPWKPSATSVIMQCDIGDLIKPEGWTVWESPEGKNNHMSCMFREFGNKTRFQHGRKGEVEGVSAYHKPEGGAWFYLRHIHDGRILASSI
ncbi:hypothetical protein L2E82_06842 [Cichorium intybus]|uniref:Uncharacterized protein n=1 Tax=Cichorium intybus TaxID=13427 RepID=A0ACB9HCA2_CICIN|nr:hypothetical protein L2E82_06842 [Cichorium intybus]